MAEEISRAWTKFRIEARVLLVDDASDNRRILSYFLTRAGAETLQAADGRAALELFEAAELSGTSFDAIVTDLEMPHIDGYELATQLRSRGATLPIVACTASSSQAAIRRCYDAGCSAHVSKPIMADDLIHTIAAILGASRRNEAMCVV
jgi:CheY-like chemotaxis protein